MSAGRRPFVDRVVDCALWVVGFVVVAPVLLLMLAGEWAFGWLTVDEPRKPGD